MTDDDKEKKKDNDKLWVGISLPWRRGGTYLVTRLKDNPPMPSVNPFSHIRSLFFLEDHLDDVERKTPCGAGAYDIDHWTGVFYRDQQDLVHWRVGKSGRVIAVFPGSPKQEVVVAESLPEFLARWSMEHMICSRWRPPSPWQLASMGGWAIKEFNETVDVDELWRNAHKTFKDPNEYKYVRHLYDYRDKLANQGPLYCTPLSSDDAPPNELFVAIAWLAHVVKKPPPANGSSVEHRQKLIASLFDRIDTIHQTKRLARLRPFIATRILPRLCKIREKLVRAKLLAWLQSGQPTIPTIPTIHTPTPQHTQRSNPFEILQPPNPSVSDSGCGGPGGPKDTDGPHQSPKQ